MYKLIAPRPTFARDITDAEKELLKVHGTGTGAIWRIEVSLFYSDQYWILKAPGVWRSWKRGMKQRLMYCE